MNKTPNYQLNQWEATDKVQRVDFNADNAKLDGALEALDAKIPRIVFGTYAGNGAESRDIYLGFQPKAVLLMNTEGTTMSNGYVFGGLATPGEPVVARTNTVMEITGTGFRVFYKDKVYVCGNSTSSVYQYIAFA